MDGWGTVKAAHKPHQWAPAPRGMGVSKCLCNLARNPVLLSNAGVGDLQSKVTGLFLFPQKQK